MTGTALWVERSRDSLALCPFGTRSPCCSVPFGRREKSSQCCSAHCTYPSDTAKQLLQKNRSLEPQGIGSCPQIGDIASLCALGVAGQSRVCGQLCQRGGPLWHRPLLHHPGGLPPVLLHFPGLSVLNIFSYFVT